MRKINMLSVRKGKENLFVNLSDGDYTDGFHVTNDNGTIVLASNGFYNRGLFTNDDFRKDGCGSIGILDVVKTLDVKGDTNKVFNIVPEKCKCGYRCGTLEYLSNDKQVKIIVNEYHEWDED